MKKRTWLGWGLALIFYQGLSAQQIRVKNELLTIVLQQVEQQTDTRFYWKDSDVEGVRVSINADCKDLNGFLQTLLAGSELNYSIFNGRYVFLLRGKQMTSTLPAFAAHSEQVDNETETSMSSLLAENLKANSENKIYAVGDEAHPSTAQTVKLDGCVTSFKTGEPITGVNMVVRTPRWTATVTDANGHYVLDIPCGKIEVELTGMGITDTYRRLMVYGDGKLDIELEESPYVLEEVTVTAGRRENVRDVQMGVQKLVTEELKTIPTAFGELDILKVVQTLPGVKTMGEASSGFNVRGGATDQNLILLNEGTIYNPTHLFGFFSAFNGNLTEGMELYKSSVPSRYGGRISSVLDIDSRKGDKKDYKGEISIGLLTGSFIVEGPLKKEKTSLLLGGRATYSDWMLGIIPEKSGYKDGKAGFYDFNAVLSHEFNRRNHFYINGYYSHDRFNFVEEEKYAYSNANASVKWVYASENNFRTAVSAGVDHYDYLTQSYQNENDAYKLSFNINQYFLKADFLHTGLKNHALNWGVNGLFYDIMPGKTVPRGENSLRVATTLQKEKALEGALYAGDEWDISRRLTMSAGVRYSLFTAFGPRTYRLYTDGELPASYNVTDTVSKSGSLKTWHGPEFRLSLRYNLMDDLSIKAGFNSMRQYIHKVSNTMIMSPTDTWKLSDMYIKPQTGQQYSVGLYKNFPGCGVETSVEGYYKTMDNYLDYRSGAQLLMNPHLETDVVPTEGRAYGVELMVKKPSGRLNGWMSYTYSRTELRQNDPRITTPVNEGSWYPAEYDKPHEVKLVGNYQFTQRYSVSFNVDYSTGRPQTMPVSKYYDHTIGASSFFYTNRNEVRIPDYFRIDLSFNIKPTHRLTAATHNFFTVGVYNLTGRKNVYSIYFVNEGEEGIKGYRMSIFGAPIPYISYNIKF